MSARDREAFATLCILLARDCKGAGWSKGNVPAFSIVRTASSLTLLAASYRRLAESACNRELTPRETARVSSLEKRLADTAAALGCGVTFAGDPRGYVVKLQLPSGASNTLGNDGWGIG